jgi:hypothetical protein
MSSGSVVRKGTGEAENKLESAGGRIRGRSNLNAGTAGAKNPGQQRAGHGQGTERRQRCDAVSKNKSDS